MRTSRSRPWWGWSFRPPRRRPPPPRVQGGVGAGGVRDLHARPGRARRCAGAGPARRARGCQGPDHLGAGARRRLRALRGRRVAGDGAGAGGRAPGDQDVHGARHRRPVGVGAARSHPAGVPRGGALGVRRLVRRPARRQARRPLPRPPAAKPFEEQPRVRRLRATGRRAPRRPGRAATRSRCASTGSR